MQFTSLVDVLEAAAAVGQRAVSVVLAVNRGRVTSVEYRRTFDVSNLDEADDDRTDELTATVALLRRYGKAKGKGRVPYTLSFTVGVGAPLMVGAALVDWMERQALPRETVPKALVEQLDVGTADVAAATVAGTGRRRELEALKVEEVRKLAASYKVAGAWRTRKGELIEQILAHEVAVAS